jgi:hypothetical protein
MSEQMDDEQYMLAMLEQIDTQQRKIQELEQLLQRRTEDVSCGDLQQRCLELERLVRDCLLYIKELSDYSWRSAPRTIKLQDWAANLGIVPEVKP